MHGGFLGGHSQYAIPPWLPLLQIETGSSCQCGLQASLGALLSYTTFTDRGIWRSLARFSGVLPQHVTIDVEKRTSMA